MSIWIEAILAVGFIIVLIAVAISFLSWIANSEPTFYYERRDHAYYITKAEERDRLLKEAGKDVNPVEQ